MVKRFEESEEAEFIDGMWFRDIDGDGVKERLVINRVTNNADGSNAQEVQNTSLRAKCFSLSSEDPLFEILIPDTTGMRSVEWRADHGIPVSWLCISPDRYVAIDWSKGKLLTETTGYAEEPTNLPITCRPERPGYLMPFPTPDGIEFRPTDAQPLPAITASESHSYADPRRMKRMFSTSGGHQPLGQWLLVLIRGGLALAVLVVLPLWYLARTVRQRRWSLSWMMLLPVIVGLAEVVWRNPSIREPALFINLLQGVTLWIRALEKLKTIYGTEVSDE